ncbi:MAG: hypothetical protein HYU33_02945 [Candidatus Omnitrophica bacterium]|nr:hypothetical protein [Candidatus Omnitrophota bacterium]
MAVRLIPEAEGSGRSAQREALSSGPIWILTLEWAAALVWDPLELGLG